MLAIEIFIKNQPRNWNEIEKTTNNCPGECNFCQYLVECRSYYDKNAALEIKNVGQGRRKIK